MATLKYWIAPLYRDPAYSLIGKTKKEVIAQLAQVSDPESYEEIHQRIIEYKDAFDLFDQVSGEGGGRFAGWSKKHHG
jgi:hypothetical protein